MTGVTTLEMVPLRSRLPYTGRVTLRRAVPVITPADVLDLQVRPAVELVPGTTTTSQVALPARDGETTARKGGEAR